MRLNQSKDKGLVMFINLKLIIKLHNLPLVEIHTMLC
jgi:hypothetical protein